MTKYRQDILSRKSLVLKHLNVSNTGIVTIGAGNVYYENSSSEYAQVVITDDFGNIQPLIFTSNQDVTEVEINQPVSNYSNSNTLS